MAEIILAGTDTIRGIAYQQAQAIHIVLDLLDEDPEGAIRVEGIHDIVDIEVLNAEGELIAGYQVKTRSTSPWTPKPLVQVLNRWSEVATPALFTFITDQDLGPKARAIADGLQRVKLEGFTPLSEAIREGLLPTPSLLNTRIVVDASGVGNVLAAAERRIEAYVEPTSRDPRGDAQRHVDRLFRLLTEKASNSNPSNRITSCHEIREVLEGLVVIQKGDRWGDAIRQKLLQSYSESASQLTELSVYELNNSGGSVPASGFLRSAGCLALSGATGSGKSSAIELAQAESARDGQIILSCRAEAYLAGRLDSLVADEIGFRLGRALPPPVGRQVLSDINVTIIIDGATEIPDWSQDALSQEIARVAQRPGSAQIVLVGRDSGQLRAMFPKSAVVKRASIAPMDQEQQMELVKCSFREAPGSEPRDVLSSARAYLLDGISNPMLLSLFLDTVIDPNLNKSRAVFYREALIQMAERAGFSSGRVMLPLLGAALAELMLRQRRYADPFEWISVTDRIASDLVQYGFSGEEMRTFAHTAGLIVSLNNSGILAPFHDSAADYLVSLAYVQEIRPFPNQLKEMDREWIHFASELGLVLSNLIVSFIPFAAVRASCFDQRSDLLCDIQEEAESLTSALVGRELKLSFVELQDGRQKVRIANDSHAKAVLVDALAGPLLIAVRIWRLELKDRLKADSRGLCRRPTSIEEAVCELEKFLLERRTMLRTFLSLFPAAQARNIRNSLGEVGLVAKVLPLREYPLFADWPVSYERSVQVAVSIGKPNDKLSGSSTVRGLLDGASPSSEASSMVKKEIEDISQEPGWLS